MKKLLFILLIVFSAGLSSPVFAAKDRSVDCKPNNFGVGKSWSLTMRAATCTKALMLTVVDNAYKITEKPAQAILAAVLLLSITLFGVKLAGGMMKTEDIRGEALMLALKAAIASFMIANYDELYEIPFDLLDSIIEVSTGWIKIAFPTEISQVCKEYLGDNSIYANDSILNMWWNYDCLGLTSLGYVTANDTSTVFLLGILLGLIVIFPIMGFLLLFLIVAFLFSIFATMFKGVIIYVRSVIILALIVIMLPFFLPFMFFAYTKGYFDQLIEVILETIFQPVVFFVIIGMFMMILLNNSAVNSPIERYWKSLEIVKDYKHDNARSSKEEQFGSEVSISVPALEGEEGMKEKYGLISSVLGTLILSFAMVAFAQNSERIATTMFTTPGSDIGSSWDTLAPNWASKGAEKMGQKADNFMGNLSTVRSFKKKKRGNSTNSGGGNNQTGSGGGAS